jgi:hypothetical protein
VTSAELRSLAANAVLSLQPLFQDMLTGTGELAILTDQVNAVTAFLTKLSAVGGLGLKFAIQSQIERVGSIQSLAGKTTAQARLAVAGVQLQLVNPKTSANGTVEFTLTGVLPPGFVQVEYSDDLTRWVPLNTGTSITNLPAVVKDSGTRSVARFYRVRVAP